MKWLEYIRLAFYEIWQNKTRTFLTLIGIIIGIAAVIIIIFVVQGAEEFLMAELQKIAPLDVMMVYGRWDPGSNRLLGKINDRDIEVIKKLEGEKIRALAPRYYNSCEVYYSSSSEDCSLIASTPEILEIYGLKIGQGRFLSNLDVEDNNQVVIINKELSEQLFSSENPIGKKVTIYNNIFTVAGVLAENEDSVLPISINRNNIFIPISVLERIKGLKNGGSGYTLMVRLKGRKFLQEEITNFREILDQRHGRTEKGRSKFVVREWASGINQVRIVKLVLIILLSGVASITLLVAGIGLMNIMLVIVTERTREIGLRKALGARRRDIMIQFIIESIVLCIIGGVLGVIIGFLGSEMALKIANNYVSFNTSVPSWAVIVSFTFTTGVGIFFGIYPAYKASRLDPIEALRYE